MDTTMNARIADRVCDLESTVVAGMLKRARELKSSGEPLISLVRGEPDFDTPGNIIHAASRAFERGETRYPPHRGIPELCVAIAEKVARDNGLRVDPHTDVLVTSGATMGSYLAIMSTVNPGDEILLPDPVYDAYRSIIRLAGGRPVPVPTEREGNHYVLPAKALEAKVSPRSKVLLLNTPWNPTGTVMTRAELEELATVALRHNLYMIMDEVYEKIIFDGNAHISLASLAEEVKSRTITVNSFSKTYAMTGWRLGYNVAPAALIDAMARLSRQSSRGPATAIQWAGVEALRGPQDQVQAMASAYARRRVQIVDGLSMIEGVRVLAPEGTFFVFVDTSAFGLDSLTLATHILEKGRVISTPGQGYGSLGQGHLRLSFAASSEDIAMGVERMRIALGDLPRD
jgi:aspartate aminotransferase